MRYFVVMTINEEMHVVAETVSEISPTEHPDFCDPATIAEAADNGFSTDQDTEVMSASELASRGTGGAIALMRWQAGDDKAWEDFERSYNTEAAIESINGDLEMMATRHGDLTAALLLREGSLVQQVEHVRGSVRGSA